jgi:hypothetical protein
VFFHSKDNKDNVARIIFDIPGFQISQIFFTDPNPDYTHPIAIVNKHNFLIHHIIVKVFIKSNKIHW